ncbi:MAG TPA: hypothetical protein VGB30_00785 [bacterium]|jgi:hypothetical protein
MAVRTDKAIADLAEKLGEIQLLDPGERHIFLLWLITRGMTLLGADRPVMVGGGSVELYTSIHIATGDLDLVVKDIDACVFVLESLGFVRHENTNHFVNRDCAMLVELHGKQLFPGEESVELSYRKSLLRVISPEDCIVNRLAEYKKHGSTMDLLSSLYISMLVRERLDFKRLHQRIDEFGLLDYYRLIQDLGRQVVLQHIGPDEVAGVLINFIKTGEYRECAF